MRRPEGRGGDPPGRGGPIAVVVDAGPRYAYVDADDRHHAASLELLQSHAGPLVVPMLVITEAVYPVATRLGAAAEVRFLGDLAAGNLQVERLGIVEVATLDHRHFGAVQPRHTASFALLP